MKRITTTKARENIRTLLDRVSQRGESFVIERHNRPEAVILPYPQAYNSTFDEITNINANSKSFDFLKKEPDLYSFDDLKKKYV